MTRHRYVPIITSLIDVRMLRKRLFTIPIVTEEENHNDFYFTHQGLTVPDLFFNPWRRLVLKHLSIMRETLGFHRRL